MKPQTQARNTPVAQMTLEQKAAWAMDQLHKLASSQTREGLSRYAIPTDNALGVAMKDIQSLGKILGKNQKLAGLLWCSSCYEARLLTAFVAEPGKLTQRQMDLWCKEFDNWAVCDTFCMHLFDRSEYAWDSVDKWHKSKGEFQKRAAFALLATLAIHDKQAPDHFFSVRLKLVRDAADDERNFVKRAVNWALRAIGNRNVFLNQEALSLAHDLAQSEMPVTRWIGKDAARQLVTPAVLKRLEKSERDARH